MSRFCLFISSLSAFCNSFPRFSSCSFARASSVSFHGRAVGATARLDSLCSSSAGLPTNSTATAKSHWSSCCIFSSRSTLASFLIPSMPRRSPLPRVRTPTGLSQCIDVNTSRDLQEPRSSLHLEELRRLYSALHQRHAIVKDITLLPAGELSLRALKRGYRGGRSTGR